MEDKGYIKVLKFENVTVVENKEYQWAVIDNQGHVVVPFGKYGWIDRFDSGLARVRARTVSERARDAVVKYFNLSNGKSSGVICKGANNEKWGIINESGEEVLPLIYDSIWKFCGKNRHSTKIEKDGKTSEVYFHDLNPSLPIPKGYSSTQSYDDEFYNEPGWGSYEEYGGYNGYDDFTIDSAFDGDPEATWNID